MNRIDKEILISLLSSKKSMYSIEKSLNGTNYPTVYRHIKKMQKEGLLKSQCGTRKNGQQDARGTAKPELTAKGLAILIIDGDLQKDELIKVMEKELSKGYEDLPSSFLSETHIDVIFADTLLRMRHKINTKFFDENYFNRIFNISFAEALLEQIKKQSTQKESVLKAKATKLKEKYVGKPQVEMLRKLRQQFIAERDNASSYVKILNRFIEEMDKRSA
jgi:hypothetical protein